MSPTMMTTIRQERARTVKALRLTAALRSAGASHADYLYGRIDWALAERVAGTNAASHATRQMVGSMLAAADGENAPDPFAGVS